MSVFDRMTQTNFNLNPSKTEFLPIGCEFQRQKFRHISPFQFLITKQTHQIRQKYFFSPRYTIYLCQLYKFIQDPCSLPSDSVHFRNDQRCTRQFESSNFPLPRCENEQSRKFYFNRVVYSWNKLPESVKNASTLLGFKKSLTTYFNDILESNFNVNDSCTWVHVCKYALCRQCS